MKINSIVKLSTVSLLAWFVALPASAQVKVGVSNNIRTTTGTEWTNQNLKINETSAFDSATVVDGKTQTIKLEAYGEVAGANLVFDGSSFKGTAFATNITPVDPIVIGVYSSYTEQYKATVDKDTTVVGTINSGSGGYFNELSIEANSYID